MKVLHLSHGCLPEMSGGVETYVDALLAEQRRQGLVVALLAGSHELRPAIAIEPQQVNGHTIHRLYRDDLYFDLWTKSYHAGASQAIDAFLARERPDVVHVHHWIRLTSDLVEIAARRGIPAIVTTHDVYTSCPRCFRVRADDQSCARTLSVASCIDCVPRFGHENARELTFGIELYHDQYRAELEGAAQVLVADPATRDLLVATTGIAPELFETLPLPYAPRFGASAKSARTPRDGEPLRFAYWGVLTHRKGAQFLAHAFRALCEEGLPRPAELHFFGRADTPALDRELREASQGLPVTFHGRYEYEGLARAGLHCAVFPMLCFETWGFVLDEAFELGLPCITTENGALARRAGGAALRVPQHDVGALRSAMRALLAEPQKLDALRKAIPAPPPGIDAHAKRLAAIYARAVEAGPRSTPPIEPARRARFAELQRESALGRAIPPGGPR